MPMQAEGQDEARRALAKAVISDWTAWLRQTGKGQPSFDAQGALAGLIFEAFEIIDDPEAHGSDPALRAEPVRAAEERITLLLREAEPTLSRHGDEIILQCPDGTITNDLYDALEATICPLPIQSAAEGGEDA